MNPDDLQTYVASGRLSQSQANKLKQLAPGSYCTHRSWGFGKIRSYDTVLDQVFIDFENKQGHPMQLAYAADSLTAIPQDHILTMKAADPEAFKARVKAEHAEIVRVFAKSLGEEAFPERLQAILCPFALTEAEWKKWLSTAKRTSKKEGLISWPVRKNQPIRVLDRPETPMDAIVARLNKARSLPDLLEVAEDVLKKIGKSEELKLLVPELVKSLDEQIALNRERNPSIVVEAIWIRDDLLSLDQQQSSGASLQSMIQEVHDLRHVLCDLSSHRQKNTLQVIKQTFPDWEARIKQLISSADAKLLTAIVNFLMAENKTTDLPEVMHRSLREQRVSVSLMLWMCKNREDSAYASWLPPLVNGRLLSVMLHEIEEAMLESGSRRKNPLTEILLDDLSLVVDMVRACDVEEARDLGKSILLNPAIDEIDKRSLMGRLIKVCPTIQSLLVNNQEKKEESLVVSWESLERRRKEYEELINKKIPENSREIAVARSYGDLRENHEYKAAKETQTVLMRLKADLEQMLARAQGTDFYKPDVSCVNIGTQVTIQPLSGGEPETYSILGAWDGDPSKNILSYQAAMARALLGKKVGEEVDLTADDKIRRVRIAAIEPCVHEMAPVGAA
ncbi:MAG: GreA/GreB family elongation factor [Verrucomicrobiae bacterium]|nr:GreA/GreB family elongation factor [Verrucomicrobiae bacterium]